MAEEIIQNKVDLVEYLLKIAPSPSVLDMLECRLDRYEVCADNNADFYIKTTGNGSQKATGIYRGIFRITAEKENTEGTEKTNATIWEKIGKNNDYFYYLGYLDSSDNEEGITIAIPENNELLGVAF